MGKIFKVLIILILGGVFCFVGYNYGVFVGEQNILRTPPSVVLNPENNKPQNVDFSVFWEAWRKAEANFLDKNKLDYKEMAYGAVKGMIESLKDPHTAFFTPQEAKDFEEDMSGEYQGVGMIIGIKSEQLTIISPLKASPAQLAGIRAGDKILKIGEEDAGNLSVEKAARLIKGKEGTKVKLSIRRKGEEKTREFEIERAVIKIPTLEWELKQDNVALIKIFQFNSILTNEFRKAASEILNSGAQKIILDLRNNPGGYLDTANQIAGWFLERGEVIVIQDSGKEEEKKTYKSEGPSTFSKYPTIILINQGSASGAEILAGALRDDRGVKLIGETSFGKGSVQEQLSLSDGSSLKVTIAKWLTPKGDSIEEKGLAPDIEVKMTEEDEAKETDPQLEKALEIIKDL